VDDMRLPAQAGHRGQHDADDVEDWPKRTYPEDFGGDKTQVIHAGKSAKANILPEQSIGRGLRLIDRVRVYPTQPLEGSLGRGANFSRSPLYFGRGTPQYPLSPKVIPHSALPSESSILASQPTGLPDLA
jgi:hypothetical protein